MLKTLFIVFALLSQHAYADTEPGGWVEPGGYDAAAEERIQKAKAEREAQALKKIQIEANKKAANKRKAAEAIALKPENMAKVEDDIACLKAGSEIRSGKHDNWQNEIKRRGLIVSKDDAKARTFYIGSNVCQIYASLGAPEKVNRTVTKAHTRKQFVYQRLYIYTENDIVSSWQD